MTPKQDQLLCRYLDGKLTGDEKDALLDLLRNSAQARRRLRILATVTEGVAGREIAPSITTPSRRRNFIPWAIAVAALVVALASWVNRPAIITDTVEEDADKFLALLVDEAGAEFSEGRSPDEVRFAEGDYELNEGAIHVRFANGADVVMKAPAAFEIDDAFHVRLRSGGMRAIVPPSAQGFTVATPGIDYEDLGTEFGISVDQDSGISKLHVFDGQVDAKDPNSSQLLSSIYEGESVQFTEGHLVSAKAPDSGKFLTPGSIGFLRWEQQMPEFGKDPDLVAYYPFIKNRRLKNTVQGSPVGDGEINGARWVSGRWPGKGALLFDRDTDFVELEVSGEFEELSFATWMKVDRFDFSHTSIFDSNGWNDGDIHWQLNRSGAMWLAPFKASGKRTLTRPEIVPTNEWVHAAGTISKKTLTSIVYVNGRLAGSSDIPDDALIMPGKSRIGNWLWDDEWPYVPIRALRGKMDEFAIWKRALTESEIKELVDRGRPAALWSTRNR